MATEKTMNEELGETGGCRRLREEKSESFLQVINNLTEEWF